MRKAKKVFTPEEITIEWENEHDSKIMLCSAKCYFDGKLLFEQNRFIYTENRVELLRRILKGMKLNVQKIKIKVILKW